MKRNVLILSCLLVISIVAFGQKKKKKKTEIPTVSTLSLPGTAFLRPVSNQLEPKFDYKQMDAPLPKFNIINYENKNITKEVLQSGGNLVMIMFNPTCEHCEEETKTLIENIFLFKKSKILLVAAAIQTPNISYFDANVKFSQYPSTITVSVDSAHVIDKLFTYKTLPQINIYDGKNLRLIRTFEGLQPLDTLRPYIE